MRALALALLLAACAAQPIAPNPDGGGWLGMEACHAVPPAAYAAATGASAAASAGGLSVNAKGAAVTCRTLDDASTACDVPGEAFVRAAMGDEVGYFHVPAGQNATVNRLRGVLTCRMMPG